ncbi:MAG: DUF2846 domain-containing protein [Pseudomonas sp.]|uniref:DUF2846 domain-containing protein n=1 Tax=Pseudomonas sp. TaxID=306 RepID=UPI003392170F
MRHLPLLMLLGVLGGCSTPGAFFGALDGPSFQARGIEPQHALVYLYRPRSDWADQELEAPGLFLDNRLIGGLPSQGHLALGFEGASYQLEMRRPLFGSYWTWFADGPLDFTRITSFALEAKPGEVYYLRYDELGPPPQCEAAPDAAEGPLQLVCVSLGETEIGATHEVQPFERITSDGQVERPQRGFWRGVGRALGRIGI